MSEQETEDTIDCKQHMADTDIDTGAELKSPNTPPATLPALSNRLSERVPAEVWRLIAFHTVEKYSIQVLQSASAEDAVLLSANKARHITNTQLVSKIFDEGVRSGFRNGFTGRIYFGPRLTAIPAFVTTILSQRLKRVKFHENAVKYASKKLCRELGMAMRSNRVSNLQEVKIKSFELDYLGVEKFLGGEHVDEVLEMASDLKTYMKDAGLDAMYELKSCKVTAVICVGEDHEAYARVRLRGKPKITHSTLYTSTNSKPLEKMSFPQFIRLSAGSDTEAQETLQMTKAQPTQVRYRLIYIPAPTNATQTTTQD